MINVSIAKHAVGTVVKWSEKHIFNIKITEDVDNSSFVGKGAFLDLDLYAQAAPGTATGTIVGKAANGNYYVEIATAAAGTLFVASVPMIEEDYSKKFQKESNFYNATGDVVRAYEIGYGDVLEISAEGFASTPNVGDAVSLQAITGKTAKQLGA